MEVSFRNKNIILNETLYIPKGQGPHPAIVFIGGSGRAPRKNVRWYAELFSYNGVGALIYDKRDVVTIIATELVS